MTATGIRDPGEDFTSEITGTEAELARMALVTFPDLHSRFAP